jgi:hypothetical protein
MRKYVFDCSLTPTHCCCTCNEHFTSTSCEEYNSLLNLGEQLVGRMVSRAESMAICYMFVCWASNEVALRYTRTCPTDVVLVNIRYMSVTWQSPMGVFEHFFCSGSDVQKQVRLSVRNMVDKGQTCAQNYFIAQLRLQRWVAAYPESGKVALLANAGWRH